MMKFLQTFFARLINWFVTRKAPDKSGTGVGTFKGRLTAGELVTRFIYTEKNIGKDKNNPAAYRPQRNAFEPPPDLELSTAHITELTENEIWSVGRFTLNSKRRKIYARADLKVADYEKRRLVATRDNDPFERHTVVTGWPNPPDPNERKSQIIATCLELCHADSLNMVVLDEPIILAD
jgi:hypothetical protein